MKVDMDVLGTDLSEIEAEINDGLDGIVRGVSGEILGELRESTPVDSGTARASWTIGDNGPSSEPPKAKGDYARPGDGRDEANRVVRKGSQRAVIQNEQEYIGVLDQGSSTQAPAGFVRRSILRGVGRALADLVFRVRG